MENSGGNSSGIERSTSGSSSFRRGRKSSSSKKPKQPQRGLGVAQLEKIRIESMGGTYPPPAGAPFYPNPNKEHMGMQEAYYSVPPPQAPPQPFDYNFHGHQNIMMGVGQLGSGNIGYGYSHPLATGSLIPGNGMLENQQYVQPAPVTRNFLDPPIETVPKKQKTDGSNSTGGSSSQNSKKSGAEEIDLTLRLA